jgi:hypothetical protein
MKWLGCLACVALVACGETAVSGEVTVRVADGAPAIIMPTECIEGGSSRGAGVELWDETGWSFHFRHDSVTGPSLQISTPAGEEAAVIVPGDCQVFRGELRQRTEQQDEIVHVTYGHLDLECQRSDGVQVEGELDFDKCMDR